VHVKVFMNGSVVIHFNNLQRLVIPWRGIIAREICCCAAGIKQVPRR
jgi:hypothetical protein